jgi:hypothetical protein
LARPAECDLVVAEQDAHWSSGHRYVDMRSYRQWRIDAAASSQPAAMEKGEGAG